MLKIDRTVVRDQAYRKYDITKHPNYQYLSDYDPRNAFNIEKFLSTIFKPEPDDVFNTYSIDLSGKSKNTDQTRQE